MPLDPLMQEIVDTVRAGNKTLIERAGVAPVSPAFEAALLAEIEEARAADARRAVLQEAADWLRSRGYHGTAEVMMKELAP